MSKKMTPGEVLNSVVECINAGNLDSLMTLYKANVCFASQPGQPAKSPESVRQSLRSFINLKGKLDLKVKRVLQASDLALVTTEWSFSGTGPEGNPVNMAAKSADVLRPLKIARIKGFKGNYIELAITETKPHAFFEVK
jgi:ketosteroid isomerase-like protein